MNRLVSLNVTCGDPLEYVRPFQSQYMSLEFSSASATVSSFGFGARRLICDYLAGSPPDSAKYRHKGAAISDWHISFSFKRR